MILYRKTSNCSLVLCWNCLYKTFYHTQTMPLFIKPTICSSWLKYDVTKATLTTNIENILSIENAKKRTIVDLCVSQCSQHWKSQFIWFSRNDFMIRLDDWWYVATKFIFLEHNSYRRQFSCYNISHFLGVIFLKHWSCFLLKINSSIPEISTLIT